MPYANVEDKRAYAREYYRKNKEQRDKQKARSADRANDIRNRLNKLRETLCCIKCSENHPAVLDFHHRDPSQKDMAVTRAIQNRWSWDRVLREIAKCDVLCSNCHRKLHWEQRNEQNPKRR